MKGLSAKELQVLAQKWLDGTILSEEKKQFDAWYESEEEAQMIVETADGDKNAFREKIMARITATTGNRKTTNLSLKRWITSVAAAAILLLALGITYLWLQPEPVTQKMSAQLYDLAPASNKAVLTLADGRTILLDSAHTGQLAGIGIGGSRVIQPRYGQLAFQPTAASGVKGLPGINTLKTPNGGKYQIQLPDGTKVWLNAASTIEFPSSFTGNAREVNITGEAYFEVVHDASKPFIVRAGKTIIKDIGTRFNVMAYGDEAIKKVTLQEGAVEVIREGNTGHNTKQLLKPGQQLQITSGGHFKLIKHMDATAAISWKEGRFNFQDAKLVEVMRQLARWYDMEVIYQNGIPDLEFIGQVQRDLPLSEVLKGLKMSGVHFKLEQGRRLIVFPE